jgi:hypothetical protein
MKRVWIANQAGTASANKPSSTPVKCWRSSASASAAVAADSAAAAALDARTAEEARGELARTLGAAIGDAPYLYDGLPAAG